jgi:arginine-tRNA-protein transferase
MKFFTSELGANYGTYTFGYCAYGTREPGDSLAEAYEKGYLPYTGSPHAPDTLYMARSARVDLAHFKLTSENRRIAKKFDGQFTKERIARKDFTPDAAFYDFCITYFAARHGEKAMPRSRLEFIMASPFITHIARYTQGDKLVGYVLLMHEGSAEHYWFSFYDLELARQSLGLWLMLDCIRDAKTAGLAQYYVGTVYGEKALYKTNFEPLEWWDGMYWNTDVKLLREHGRSDQERTIPLTDTWKQQRKLF